jgi:hypothetical protein
MVTPGGHCYMPPGYSLPTQVAISCQPGRTHLGLHP